MTSFRDPIRVERVIGAPPQDVFAAWSDAESLRAWMCPSPIQRADAEVDFRVGGRFRIVMHGAERRYGQVGEYLEIDPPKRLVFTWESDWVPAEYALTRVSVSFEAVGEDHTRLVLVHENLVDDGTYDGHEQGWADIVRKLHEHLTQGATP